MPIEVNELFLNVWKVLMKSFCSDACSVVHMADATRVGRETDTRQKWYCVYHIGAPYLVLYAAFAIR